MANLQLADQTQWLSLRDACALLQVSQATLRHWADAGHLRVYRTPGGHRRFAREDLLALTSRQPDFHATDTPDKLEDAALRRIRRRLNHEEVARQPWYQSVEEEGRDRMRLFGRRLLSLLVQGLPRRRASGRRQAGLAEALMLGHEYGAEMSERNVPLKDTVEAFIFFRTLVLDSTENRTWGATLELADQVLVGVVESYQKRMELSAPGRLPTETPDAHTNGG
jgi:excisionase family DNA binding protein